MLMVALSAVPAFAAPFTLSFVASAPSTPLMRALSSFRGRAGGIQRYQLRLPFPISCRARADAESTSKDSSVKVPLVAAEEMRLAEKVAGLDSSRRIIVAEEVMVESISRDLESIAAQQQDDTLSGDKRARLEKKEDNLLKWQSMILNVLEGLYNDASKLKQEIKELDRVCWLILSLCPFLLFFTCLPDHLAVHSSLGNRSDVHSFCFALQHLCLKRLAFIMSTPHGSLHF